METYQELIQKIKSVFPGTEVREVSCNVTDYKAIEIRIPHDQVLTLFSDENMTILKNQEFDGLAIKYRDSEIAVIKGNNYYTVTVNGNMYVLHTKHTIMIAIET